MHNIKLTEKVKLTWMVDWADREVFFQVKNGINEKYSWFAVGFSRRGDFPRTDFCIFQKSHEQNLIDIINVVSFSSFLYYVFLSISSLCKHCNHGWIHKM